MSITKYITTRPVELKDIFIIYKWRNDPEIFQYFRNQSGKLLWNNHKLYWKKELDKDIHYMIDFNNDIWRIPIGYYSIDNYGKITILIGQKYFWNRGIATYVLENAIEKSNHNHLFCEIHYKNQKSINLFNKLGFEYIDTEKEWHLYGYKNN